MKCPSPPSPLSRESAAAPEADARRMARLTERIRDKALALGFDAIGFCPAHLGPEVRARLADFLASGQHGSMGWLAERTAERAQPTALWPQARSVVCLGVSYAPETDPRIPLPPDRGTISVYARHRDYHDMIKGMLKHLAQFMIGEAAKLDHAAAEVKVFVDTAPVAEKPLAAQAGLGWQGKHTNLVSRQHGSWLFLGEVYTTLALTPSPPPAGGCGTCTRCLNACPTNAFPAPYQLDARRCISYLTIEHAGPIPLELRRGIGTRIYGCDDCLAVCPWNRFAQTSRHPKLQPRADLMAPELTRLSQLDDAAFRTLFSGSPIKRIGRNRFIRNVLMAIGNSGLPALRPAATALLNDPDPVVAEAAQWALAQPATPEAPAP